MSSAQAWQDHGCYHMGAQQYYQWPLDAGRHGCTDDKASHDHRDPSAPVRNIIKHMFHLRELFPVLNDGYMLQQLSNMTREILLPGSDKTPTEIGIWSVVRSRYAGGQNFEGQGQGNQSVWLIYHNDNTTIDYEFDCSNDDVHLNTTAMISPFASGTFVKNLFEPYETLFLESSPRKLGLDGSTYPNGCLRNLTMPAYGFKAFVPIQAWRSPKPVVSPGSS